jgi:hypothetical protein
MTRVLLAKTSNLFIALSRAVLVDGLCSLSLTYCTIFVGPFHLLTNLLVIFFRKRG